MTRTAVHGGRHSTILDATLDRAGRSQLCFRGNDGTRRTGGDHRPPDVETVMSSIQDIRTLLQLFQHGYTRRDMGQVEAFMALFTPDAEVIGTNGVGPGVGEWCLGREAARALVAGDWESWGDLRLDLETARVSVHGDVGWIAAYATVTQTIGAEGYVGYLDRLRETLATAQRSPAAHESPVEQMRDILRGASNTLYELERGERFVWPLRFTAVVVQSDGVWQFAQIHFSYATTRFPDVRLASPD